MTTTPMTLYTWWRSQASFRVRIALHLKGLKAEMVFIDLSKDDQLAAPYRFVNPEMVLPTLIDGEGPPLRQSLAILEYLEEQYPEQPLLPTDAHARAHVRALAQVVAVDAHPFVAPRVRKYLEQNWALTIKYRWSGYSIGWSRGPAQSKICSQMIREQDGFAAAMRPPLPISVSYRISRAR